MCLGGRFSFWPETSVASRRRLMLLYGSYPDRERRTVLPKDLCPPVRNSHSHSDTFRHTGRHAQSFAPQEGRRRLSVAPGRTERLGAIRRT
jgi:hypothetical protein